MSPKASGMTNTRPLPSMDNSCALRKDGIHPLFALSLTQRACITLKREASLQEVEGIGVVL